jgi:hypothetical protein
MRCAATAVSSTGRARRNVRPASADKRSSPLSYRPSRTGPCINSTSPGTKLPRAGTRWHQSTGPASDRLNCITLATERVGIGHSSRCRSCDAGNGPC